MRFIIVSKTEIREEAYFVNKATLAEESELDRTAMMCEVLHMATNLAIDDQLLNKALKISGFRTKKDTVNEALKEFIQRREQKKVVELFGTAEYYDDYQPKKYRRK